MDECHNFELDFRCNCSKQAGSEQSLSGEDAWTKCDISTADHFWTSRLAWSNNKPASDERFVKLDTAFEFIAYSPFRSLQSVPFHLTAANAGPLNPARCCSIVCTRTKRYRHPTAVRYMSALLPIEYISSMPTVTENDLWHFHNNAEFLYIVNLHIHFVQPKKNDAYHTESLEFLDI